MNHNFGILPGQNAEAAYREPDGLSQYTADVVRNEVFFVKAG